MRDEAFWCKENALSKIHCQSKNPLHICFSAVVCMRTARHQAHLAGDQAAQHPLDEIKDTMPDQH